MFDSLNKFLFSSITENGLTLANCLICIAASIVCGALVALAYAIKSRYTKNFLITLVLLPVIVMIVIMMVKGSIGAGVAVAGAFSLVRFRSVPGNSKDICCIFFAMATGIATGTGQVVVAIIFTIIVCAILIVMKFLSFGEKAQKLERELKITVPEDLDYEREFAEIFARYLKTYQISKVKTSNMGSLFVLHYKVSLIPTASEKSMIDDLRVKNGNLPIVCANGVSTKEKEEL